MSEQQQQPYLVSARKYRPSQFDDVVGQEHVTTTLKNALKNDQLAQSFLFCGPRGVGKTSCARILAKVLNCQNVTENREPCNTCESCSSFNQNASFNIFELDAASNNSVEDIRQLIEQVRFSPQSGKYKVYIIDEVHMLSSQAFNAFLKTLEEPPSYAVFILATTEKHKILPTIISRCQVFDFQRITNSAMVTHLQKIAEQENIEAEIEALHVVAQKADGGLRDALSIFDRMSSFADGAITYQSVLENLNILDGDYYFKLTDGIRLQDRSLLMLTLNDILRLGFDGSEFINGLAAHFRDLLMAQSPQTLPILEVSEQWKKRYAKQAQGLTTGLVLSCLNIANACALGYRDAKNKRLQIELALLKMCYVNQAIERSALPDTPLATANEAKPTTAIQPQIKQQPQQETKSLSSINIKKETPTAQTPPHTVQEQPLTDFSVQKKKETPAELPETVETPIAEAKTAQIVVPEPTEDAPKKYSFKNRTQKVNDPVAGFNLGSLNNVSAGISAKQEQNKKAVIDMDPANLQARWQQFITENESPRTQKLLETQKVVFEGNEIHCEASNSIAHALLNVEFKKFVAHLQAQFDGVNLLIKLLESSTAQTSYKPQVAYTAEDKFKAMAEKNPNLQQLRDGLGLEIEY